MYIEKEGFEPLLKESRIAERFDLAILSCKGQSVVAARKLVDNVCRVDGGVPLFTVHDFDKYGFEIADCLSKESAAAKAKDRVAYRFQNKINAIDLGLRLSDVERYKLPSETCRPKGGRFSSSLNKEERAFLSSCRRVELNNFTAPQFVEWLESKLKEHLPNRLLPDEEVLVQAYQRSRVVARINQTIDEVMDNYRNDGPEDAPENLRDLVVKEMKRAGISWDRAVYNVAEAQSEDD